MSNVIPFVPKTGLAAKAALSEFVNWAKSQIQLYDRPSDPFQWEAKSWHRWGLAGSVFSKLGSNEALHPDFIDYVKAMLFEERVVQLRNDPFRLYALRCLEVAILESTQRGDVTAVTAAIFDRACAIAQDYYKTGNTPYQISRKLKYINDYLQSAGMVAKPFMWEPQVKNRLITLKKSAEDAKKKLPSDRALIALGEIFHSKPGLPLDIMTTSAVGLMLSHPCRISELLYVKKDCLFKERDAHGRDQLYILWHSRKGFGANRKPIPDSMAETCQEAVKRVIEITQEARVYAKWLEENPELFPSHAGVPKKGLDEPLTTKEACDALMITTAIHSSREALRRKLSSLTARQKTSGSARKIAQEILDGYDASDGVRTYANGRLARFTYNDTFEITLRKLNQLVRSDYLPEHFPYTDARRINKWQDALFCFRTGTLSVTKRMVEKPFGLTGCQPMRLNNQLTGCSHSTKSIFERHGYDGVTVNSHAFRHYLNTGAQRAGLSQELIARWSGRVDVGQNRVYNHMSADEKLVEMKGFTPPMASAGGKLLTLLKSNAPISMRDLEGGTDRIVHRTEFGVCIHDYAQEPCAKFNNCLTCQEHVCVKGDETRLVNIKEEREYLRRSLVTFQQEADEGTYGANTWLRTTMEKIERCDQLIRVLQSPDIQDGALVKGMESGWTAGCNALAMRGELVEEDASLIATDAAEDRVAELKRLLGMAG